MQVFSRVSAVRRSFVAVVASVGAVMAMAGSAHAYVFSSEGQWASWTDGTYTVYNDVWGNSNPSQWLNVNNKGSWNVVSNQTGGGVKSYGNVSRNVNKTLSSLKSCKASFNTSTGSGSFDNSFDVWSSGNADEIMIWENWGGQVGPIGSQKFANVSVGGSTWNVYQGNIGWNVVSLLRTSQRHSGTEDVLAIFNWVKSKGMLVHSDIGQLQFGFEISNTSGWQTFTMNSYSVSFS